MEPTDDFIIRLLNIWFYKEPPHDTFSKSARDFGVMVAKMVKYGDDAVYSHDKIGEIIMLCKDFGLVDYDKSIKDLYFEGKIRVQVELRNAFNSPEVSRELEALLNVLGNVAHKIAKDVRKQIEEEKNRSAIPELKDRRMFRN